MPSKDTRYTEAQIVERLGTLQGWSQSDNAIHRTYETDGWPITLMLVNAIAFVAEAANHHPDLSVTWARVTVKLTTQIDILAVPPSGGP